MTFEEWWAENWCNDMVRGHDTAFEDVAGAAWEACEKVQRAKDAARCEKVAKSLAERQHIYTRYMADGARSAADAIRNATD